MKPPEIEAIDLIALFPLDKSTSPYTVISSLVVTVHHSEVPITG